MEEEDDREEWIAGANTSTAVVAHELICLSRPWKRVSWRRLLRRDNFSNGGGGGDEKELEILQEEMGVLEQVLELPPGWGARRRRSRKPDDLICEEEATKELARASPATPFDFSAGSGASTSGGEDRSSGATTAAAATTTANADAVVRRESLETLAKVGPKECAQADFRIPAAKQIRRPGKKKTIQELQVLEKSCLDERLLLQRELESRSRACELLVEENQKLKRLKLFLLSKSVPPLVEDKPSNQLHDNQCCDGFALPDLNEPWPDDFN